MMVFFYLQLGCFSNQLTTASSFRGHLPSRGRSTGLPDQRRHRPVRLACHQHRSRRRPGRRSWSRDDHQAATSRCLLGQPRYSEEWRLEAHCWLLLDFRVRQFVHYSTAANCWHCQGHCCRTNLATSSAHTAISAAVAGAGHSACQRRRPG